MPSLEGAIKAFTKVETTIEQIATDRRISTFAGDLVQMWCHRKHGKADDAARLPPIHHASNG